MFSLLFNASLHKQDQGEAFLEFLNDSTPFCSQFMSGQWYCYLLLVLFSFALPVGIVGNIAALLAFSCFRKTVTPGSVFLLNLALCDSAWVFMLPFSIYFTLQQPYLHGIHMFCQFKKVSFNVNIYGSIFFLTLVSFDRYVGTVHPISSLCWWDVGRARVCSGVAWALLLLGSIPDLFSTFGVQRPGNITVCMDHIQGPFEYVKSITLVRTLVGFVVPFAAMLGFYASTVRVIRGLSWRRRRPNHKRQRLAKGKPLLLITAALLVFVVSFVPYHVMIVTLLFLRVHGLVTPANTGMLYATYEFLESICSISSCLDPILYILASERFQKRLQRLRQGRSGRGGGEGEGGGGGGGEGEDNGEEDPPSGSVAEPTGGWGLRADGRGVKSSSRK